MAIDDGQNASALRVFLVDDHQMLTEALAVKLSTTPDLRVVGQCLAEASEPAEMAAQLDPDVVTVEAAHGCDPAPLITRLRSAGRPPCVVVLTASHDPQEAVRAARAGAEGWVPKESSVDTLAETLRGVCRGDAYFPPEQLGHVLRGLREDARLAGTRTEPLHGLTRRERAVLQGWVEGRTSAQIADGLNLSANTVRTHAKSIFTKLRVHHRLEAVRAARAAGMRPGSTQPDGTSTNGIP